MAALNIKALTSPRGILRIVEFVFSIIVFACVAEYDGWDKVNYTLWTGITTMILTLVYIVLYLLNVGENRMFCVVEVVIDVIWWVFWLACAAVLSDVLANWSGNWGGFYFGTYYSSYFDKSKFQASCAFAWLTFFLWTASTALNVMNLMKGRQGPSAASDAAPDAGAGAPPAKAVAGAAPVQAAPVPEAVVMV